MSWLSSHSIALMARYIAAGGLSTLFGYGVIAVEMAAFAMPPLAANATGFAAGCVFSFLLHRSFTFRSRVGLSAGLTAYLPVVAVGYAANVGVLLLSTGFLRLDPYLAQALAIATYVVLTFLGSSKFVFGKAR